MFFFLGWGHVFWFESDTDNKSLPGEKKIYIYISTHETGSNIVNPIIKLAVRGFIVSLNQSFLQRSNGERKETHAWAAVDQRDNMTS